MSESNEPKTSVPPTNNSGIPTENPMKPSNNVPPPPSLGGSEFDWVTDSCVFKATLSTVMGGALGFAFGGFFGVTAPAPDELAGKSVARQVLEGFKVAGKSGTTMAKQFAVVGLVFSSSECAIETYRAKTDRWNSVAAGCFSGALLASRVGPKAMGFGCVSFAAFSYAIDAVTGRHSEADQETHDK